MLYRQLRTSQVKCNFCLEWITLSLDFKFNINVCDDCLQKGCKDNALKAVDSFGRIYQIYIVKQNSILELPKKLNNFHPISQNNQTNTFVDTSLVHDKEELLEEIDQQKSTEIKEILEKWSLLESFLNEKETLSKEEINFIKNIISEKAINLEKLYGNLNSEIIQTENQNEWTPVEFEIHSESMSFEDEPENFQSINNYDFPEINIKIIDKENLPLKSKTAKKNEENPLKFKERTTFKSPNRNPLKEKDLNSLHVSLTKISGLKENNQTPEKRLHTQFFDENESFQSSCLKNSFVSFKSSAKSSLKSSMFNSITKRLSKEEIKKFEQTKNKISKYLEKNCESNSLGRLMLSVVFEAFSNTSVVGRSMELISYNLSFTDFKCYLEAFDWTGIEVLKLVKTKLTDEHLKTLIDFIVCNDLGIKVLVLTSNRLTEASIEYLNVRELSHVREIYLGKNRISKGKVRDEIRLLKNKYSLYL